MSRKLVLLVMPVVLILSGLACSVAPLTLQDAAPSAPAGVAAAAPTAAPAAQAPAAAPLRKAGVPAGAAAQATGAPAAENAASAAPGATPALRPADAFFKEYGVNPFVDTRDDHLSTFALDVDTASYTLARRYVGEGQLPPQAAIRTEEFVNYFRQDYPYPPQGQAFAVHMDGASSPFGETPQSRILRIGIQGYDVPPDRRKPAVLTFIIDVSGSMSDNGKLDMVKSALASLVERLRPNDQVSIVAYSTDAGSILPPTSGRDKDAIMSAIERLQPQGSTNAEAGLILGYRQAESAFNSEATNRVILASDGVANVGNTGPGSIWERIKGYADRGINMTAVGVGIGEYNDVLLEQLADQGKGVYFYVDGPQEAERIFGQNLTGTLQAIAEDAKVQVDFDPATVARYRLLGFENRAIADTQFRVDTGKAAQIGAGHHVTALYEVDLQPGATGRLATVTLRWKDPESQEVTESEQPFDSADLAPIFSEASPRLQWSAIVAEYAEVLRGSPFAKNSSLAGVLEEAQRAVRLLPDDADAAEFVNLVARARELAGGK